MRISALFLALFIVGGCTTAQINSMNDGLYDVNHIKVSEFDGSLIRFTDEIPIGPSGVLLNAYWDSKSPDTVIFGFKLLDRIVNISSVDINVDGSFYRMSEKQSDFTKRQFEDYSGKMSSSQGFVIPKSLFEKISASTKVVYKINYLDGTYYNITCDSTGISCIPKFKFEQFYKLIALTK
ncbi:MAG: hypothetical protein E6Q75_11550 [Rheinheimera sp.]|nr:MAG: hypothetical protein E6Q75_11550 [Rheinheimera sp.]